MAHRGDGLNDIFEHDVIIREKLTCKSLNVTGDIFDGTSETYGGSIQELGTACVSFIIDGGGVAITTGIKGDLVVPFNCIIRNVVLLSDQTGSIAVDIWKDTYANYPPTAADSITYTSVPTITTSNKYTNTTLTGWTTRINKGSTLRFNVDSCTTIIRVVVALEVTKIYD